MGKISEEPVLAARQAAAVVPMVFGGANYQQSVAALLAGYALIDSIASGNYLVDGGGVAWEGDYDYHVSAATYVIQGAQYTSAAADVTLSAADPTDPRIDIIAVDDGSAVVVIEGTPAANPQAPDVDAETQLQLTFVYVAAGSTAPDVSNTDLYLDNAEWTYTDNAATLDGDSVADPRTGTKSIEATAAVAGDLFTLQRPSGTEDPANYNSLVLWLKPKATWPANKNLKLFFLNAGVQVGTQVVVKNGTYGFVTSAATYQAIVVPISDFNTSGQPFNRLRVKVAGGGAAIGFFVDDVILQAGVAPNPAAGAMLYIGDWSSGVAYSPQQVVRNGGYQYVAVLANQNSAPQPDDSNAAWKRAALNLRFDIDGTLAGNSDSFVATQKATKTAIATALATAEAYTDSHVVGLWDDRGAFDASVNAYPSSGGSGTAGAILKGDIWTVGVAGILPTGQVVVANDTVRALVDTPGNTQANWAIAKDNTQTSVSGNAGTATALQTARNIDGVSFDGTADITVIAPGTHAATSKATPVDADELPLVDSAASNVLKKLTWANLKATAKTYFDTLYQALDSDLTTIAGLTATTDSFMQAKSSAWASRTVAQVSADLQATGLVTDAVGFRTIPQNSQSAAYTTVAADSGKHLLHPSGDANARTYTIDSNANVAYPLGTAITFVNETSQALSIAITSDTLTLAGTTTSGTRSLAQNGVATAVKVTTTKWIISGTGLT